MCGDDLVHVSAIPTLRADLARVTAQLDALQRHYDAAAPEHNLLALLDLYHSREQLVIDRVSEWKRNFAGAKEYV